MGASRQTPAAFQAVRPRSRCLPPMARSGDQSHSTQDNRLPRGNRCPIAAWPAPFASRNIAAKCRITPHGRRGCWGRSIHRRCFACQTTRRGSTPAPVRGRSPTDQQAVEAKLERSCVGVTDFPRLLRATIVNTSVLWDRPACSAAQAGNLSIELPFNLPSDSTMSRRLRTFSV